MSDRVTASEQTVGLFVTRSANKYMNLCSVRSSGAKHGVRAILRSEAAEKEEEKLVRRKVAKESY